MNGPEFMLPVRIATLREEGEALLGRIKTHLDEWPTFRAPQGGEFDHDYGDPGLPAHWKEATDGLTLEVQRWFSRVALEALPLVLFDRQELLYARRHAEAATRKRYYVRPHPRGRIESVNTGGQDGFLSYAMAGDAREDIERDASIGVATREAEEGIGLGITVLLAVPPEADLPSAPASAGPPPRLHVAPNTAFILMWMSPEHPELDDIVEAIREVCRRFGLHAQRADDVEHQERITDVILRHIAEAEFLVADLTGERPNVYYEVGYAHALGKRPILFRKAGTPLHFDLAGHNIPEYRNVKELKEKLTKRLTAMLGREPSG